MLYDDTIAAIATPPGEGGIGVVRLSGPQAIAILEGVFVPARAGRWHPFRMRYGQVQDASGARIDEALAVIMRAPHSFTAEDVAEISCHGGPLVVGRVLAELLRRGARQAEPGEFTMRAFVNGRIDLTQAEATLDIISARTTTGLALAQAQLGGWLSGEVQALRELLLEPLAYCTVLVDFPEDEVNAQDIRPPLLAAQARLAQLLASSEQGIIYRQGARLALVGVPNVGKSSLLNALLRSERAIVTPIPGTTRDTLEETANLAGIPVVLTDTAGFADTNDPVEQLGIERSRAALASADLVLLVLDASRPLSAEEHALASQLGAKPVIVVLNKLDLLEDQASGIRDQGSGDQGITRPGKRETVDPTPNTQYPIFNAGRSLQSAISNLQSSVSVSALTGSGLDTLTEAIARSLLGRPATGDTRLVSNTRHRDALARAASHLADALAAHQHGIPADLLAVDLTAALAALGEITGDGVGDDLLATIFSRFCIGK